METYSSASAAGTNVVSKSLLRSIVRKGNVAQYYEARE